LRHLLFYSQSLACYGADFHSSPPPYSVRFIIIGGILVFLSFFSASGNNHQAR